MKNIGQRIKELRKKNDLTQDKLADHLGVTYQSVSKWETGVTYPDLSLIVPLAKLLNVSTDELLGVNACENDARRAELDKRCEHYWKYDNEENYFIALQAVAEYPRDYKYIHWLAKMEYFVAWEDKYRKDGKLSYSSEMIERSIKHNSVVIADCNDTDLRHRAIWDVMIAYQYTDRHDEALKYAQMFPDKRPITRNQALAACLQGDEQISHMQKMAKDELRKLAMSFMELYRFATVKEPYVMSALDTEESVLRAVFPDENYLNFNWHMYCIYEKRTELEILSGEYDRAMEYLGKACCYAKAYDKLCSGGVHRYTCGVFDRCREDMTDNDFLRPFWSLVKDELTTEAKYAPLRDREDFKTLLD